MSNLADIPVNTPTNPLSVTLVMTPEIATQLQRDAGALEVAQAYVIDGAEMATLANDELKAVKDRLNKLAELKEGFLRPAREIVANAEALFDPAIRANKAAEAHLKQALIAFQAEERRKVEEARRAQEEAERKARQEAAAIAAKARAAAEEKAREARRQAQELELERQQAETDGNARAAAAAAAKAAEATAKAAAAIENGEAKAQEVELAAAASVAPVEVIAPTKLAGFSTRAKWSAVLAPNVSSDYEAIKLIAAAIPTRPDLVAYLAIDWKAANKTASAQKAVMSIPGLIAKEEQIGNSRR